MIDLWPVHGETRGQFGGGVGRPAPSALSCLVNGVCCSDMEPGRRAEGGGRRTEGGGRKKVMDTRCAGGEPHKTGGNLASGSRMNGEAIGVSHCGDPCSGCRPRSKRSVDLCPVSAVLLGSRLTVSRVTNRAGRRAGSVGSDLAACLPAQLFQRVHWVQRWRSGSDERWCASQVRSIRIAIYNRRVFAKIVRGIFHDWVRPSVQVVCGLGEGTREKNIPSCDIRHP